MFILYTIRFYLCVHICIYVYASNGSSRARSDGDGDDIFVFRTSEPQWSGWIFSETLNVSDDDIVAWASAAAVKTPLNGVHFPFWAKKTCPLLKLEFSHDYSERLLQQAERNLVDADQETTDLRNLVIADRTPTRPTAVSTSKGTAKGATKGVGDGSSGWVERCCALMIAV